MKNLIKTPSYSDTEKVLQSLAARGNNLFLGSLRKNIFFVHIPKCGGTSIQEALKSHYVTVDVTKDSQIARLNSTAAYNAAQISANQTDLPSDTIDDYQILKFRENLLLYYMSQGRVRLIAGHFTFSPVAYEHFSNKYAFVTVLRDPVKRWVSAYFYNRYKKLGHRKVDTEISTYLESDFGKAQGHEYVKFLGGIVEAGDYRSELAINRAKENLHKFSVVGCLEYQENFVKQFEQQFDRRLKIGVAKPVNHQHVKPWSLITEEIEEKIKVVCKPDIEVYQYAIANFVKPFSLEP